MSTSQLSNKLKIANLPNCRSETGLTPLVSFEELRGGDYRALSWRYKVLSHLTSVQVAWDLNEGGNGGAMQGRYNVLSVPPFSMFAAALAAIPTGR